jgi:hypothetical protein
VYPGDISLMNWVPGNDFSMGYFLLPLDVARSQAQVCTHTHGHNVKWRKLFRLCIVARAGIGSAD